MQHAGLIKDKTEILSHPACFSSDSKATEDLLLKWPDLDYPIRILCGGFSTTKLRSVMPLNYYPNWIVAEITEVALITFLREDLKLPDADFARYLPDKKQDDSHSNVASQCEEQEFLPHNKKSSKMPYSDATDIDRQKQDLKILYENVCLERQKLSKEHAATKKENTKLQSEKSSLQKSLNTADKMIYGMATSKFGNNNSKIANIRTALALRDVPVTEKTIRAHCDRGEELIKEDSKKATSKEKTET